MIHWLKVVVLFMCNKSDTSQLYMIFDVFDSDALEMTIKLFDLIMLHCAVALYLTVLCQPGIHQKITCVYRKLEFKIRLLDSRKSQLMKSKTFNYRRFLVRHQVTR